MGGRIEPNLGVVCGKPVHGSCKTCAEADSHDLFSTGIHVDRENEGCGERLRAGLRLTGRNGRVRSSSVFTPTPIHVNVHHFEHDIGGRLYQIEVTSVGNRWRAQLRRAAGMPTAMMPFYGVTPEEAAEHLTRWLTLAHRRPTAAPAPSPIA